MLKRILTILFMIATVGYLGYAIYMFSGFSSDIKCKDIKVEIKDNSGQVFVKESEVKQLLKDKGIRLKGKKIDEINYGKVERALVGHKLIERAECYASPSGKVYIDIWQHLPVLRIISENDDYYVDSNGEKTGLSPNSVADVVIASGNINDKRTVKELYDFSVILKGNPYWDSLVEQIYVEPDGEWTLIPRAGDFEIELGMPVDLETKMERIGLFVRDYLPVMGWGRYSKISLKFNGQIVCTINK